MWSRTNRPYRVTYLGSPLETPGIMIQALWYPGNAFFDWSTRHFVTTDIVQAVQPLIAQTFPPPVGTAVVRFTLDVKTTDFPDGDYAVFHVNGDGSLSVTASVDYFSVYQGSSIGVIPTPQPGTYP